jgi:hypothetical protein
MAPKAEKAPAKKTAKKVCSKQGEGARGSWRLGAVAGRRLGGTLTPPLYPAVYVGRREAQPRRSQADL